LKDKTKVWSKTAPAYGAAAYQKVQTATGPTGELGLEREIASLREYVTEQLGELKNLFLDLAHRQSLTEKWRERPDVVGLYRRLLATGLSPQWAREFVEKSAESTDAWGGELTDHLRQTLKPRLRCLSPESALPRLIALTGPTGSGKTTALVRLAAWSQKKGRKVSAITLDTLKLGAVEQLTQYARIMGLGLRVCQNRAEFSEANELFQDSDLVLIDTNTRDFTAKGAADDLSAALLEAGAKRLLVLPAGLKNEDLDDLHRNMAGPTLLGLVLTKLDETLGLGNVLGFLAGHGPPLGFFSVGPRTPEDFMPAEADKLLDYWLSPETIPKTNAKSLPKTGKK
jgi:flagellar biosynthesis protein FlhF